MEDKRVAAARWLHIATADIRFEPDRKAVERELREHIEDKTLDFQRIFPGMAEEDAQLRAVSEMGDAQEVGRELARIHKPWLGYLWKVSRVLVLTLLCLWAVALLRHGRMENIWFGWEENREFRAVSQILYGDGQPDWEGERLALYSVDEEARLGRCTISVDRAALWREEDGNTLYADLRLDFDRPWEAGNAPFFSIWAEDDLGNRYQDGETHYGLRGRAQGLGWREINLTLEKVPAEAGWVKIHYMPGTGLDLTLDLREEGTP